MNRVIVRSYERKVLWMCMEFTKYHSLGNDYLVYDSNRNKPILTAEKIRAVCHRQFGLGADGILLGPFLSQDGIRLKIYNSDGSEAENSGNGVLIFAKYMKDAGYIQKKEFDLLLEKGVENRVEDGQQTGEGNQSVRRVRIRYNNEQGTCMTVNMGQLMFTPEAVGCSYHPREGEVAKSELVDIPMQFGDYTYRCTCVSIGNPHCVLPFKTVTKGIVCDVGEKIENSSYFTRGINTQIVQVTDRHNVRIEIYERGAGYTLASGSSACAAVGAMHKMRFVDSKVWVHMPGGKLLVCVDDAWNVDMTGNVSSIGTMRLTNEYILEKMLDR
ncbi:MAG: diaminopimelate epimerase [Wujia sp.]